MMPEREIPATGLSPAESDKFLHLSDNIQRAKNGEPLPMKITAGYFLLNIHKGKKEKSFYAVEIRAATGSTLDLIISTLRVG